MVDKKIVIHIGPPKTGSSALETWLVNNRQFLLRNGFYYPEHSIDINNVSSGNVLSVFSPDDKDELSFSREKANTLLADFENSGAQTLLLSSEYFFLRLDVLSEAFPAAIFVGYVRNPLDFMESDYNQSIKRHGNSKTINLKPRINASILRRLGDNVDVIGEDRFHLRAYHSELFSNRDIVQDFLQYLGISGASGITGHRVNSSYCYEAMEVKRWLNQFELGDLNSHLDLALQKFEQGTKKYSLIAPVEYGKFRVQSINTVIDFCKRHLVINSEELVKAIKKRKHSPYFEQELNYEHAKVVVDFIRENTELKIYQKICRSIKEQKNKCIRHLDFIPAFIDSNKEIGEEKSDVSQPKRNLKELLLINVLNGFVIKWLRKLF